MSALRELYQEVILDHNRSPRNFRRMEDPSQTAEGNNPLCGDHYTVYLKVEGDVINDITFEGAGCAISKASASLMSGVVKGKTRAEAVAVFEQFHKLVIGEFTSVAQLNGLGKLAAFAGVSEFPARVKCAILAWHTLRAALESRKEPVTTE